MSVNPTFERRELMLGDPVRLARARRTLGSMSDFMKHLKQPIARRANLEDDCTGHFFDQRFYSGALLTEAALVAAMAYVDLNPVRAKLAKRIEDIRDTSIGERLVENSAEALEDYLRPLLSGLGGPPADAPPGVVVAESPSVIAPTEVLVAREAAPEPPDGGVEGPDPEHAGNADTGAADSDTETADEDTETADEDTEAADAGTAGTSPDGEPAPAGVRGRRPRLPFPHVTLAQYIELVRAMVEVETARSGDAPDGVRRWLARTKSLGKRQRAYGSESALRHWTADRSLQLRENPLPA